MTLLHIFLILARPCVYMKRPYFTGVLEMFVTNCKHVEQIVKVLDEPAVMHGVMEI